MTSTCSFMSVVYLFEDNFWNHMAFGKT